MKSIWTQIPNSLHEIKLIIPRSLRFSPAIEFNNNVSSICLPEQDEVFAPGTKCYASGWGYGPDEPELLFQVFYQDLSLKHLQRQVRMSYNFWSSLLPF